jgi:16S rRNA (guanine527-N7)-methyltransferase
MLTASAIQQLLVPYVGSAASELGVDRTGSAPVDWPRVYGQLAVYFELIVKWNARMNLTAVRAPEEIVRRHFGESLFAGAHLGACATLLDFGSGAGFPGLPMQLMRPGVQVTLAESQGKKAAFLREAVRELGLGTEVWAGRVEAMPAARQFDCVALRAVDKMAAAVREAAVRAVERLLIVGTFQSVGTLDLGVSFQTVSRLALPESRDGVLLIARR